MIGSVVILRKSYAWVEYIAAALLVGSACLFSLGDIAVTPEYSTVGIIIVLISLIADALHSNTQESVLKEQKAPESEVMLFTNMFATVYDMLIMLYQVYYVLFRIDSSCVLHCGVIVVHLRWWSPQANYGLHMSSVFRTLLHISSLCSVPV